MSASDIDGTAHSHFFYVCAQKPCTLRQAFSTRKKRPARCGKLFPLGKNVPHAAAN
jgi:hypothetical protein